MRLAVYSGTSAALAAAVITSAFWQRANFYSAMVYLSQSNLCLMILVNLFFLIYGSFMYGLQRLCFGTLRPVEVEQLYEKAWFAVTETCLAMTVFRDDVGAFFLVMFTALITGKVWGWIGEGRVEVLEQQPPANPRLFHTRLVVSLLTSVIYNCWLLNYSIRTVIAVAKPTMMVMFLFEFAVLAVSSLHTALRYVISLVETSVVKKQTQTRLRLRRAEVRRERDEILRRREAGELGEEEGGPLPDPDEVEEMDIEVPGWETKGQWVLFLDIFADFLKLSVYVAFFGVLFAFYGLPIHIMRGLFMTTRSFVKRLSALLKYKQALRDMNRYPDARAEDLGREDTCIICREEMRPWDPNAGQLERHRPKKLPCGHILHFGCLKSWLERQQVCPTCRSSVVADPQQRNGNYPHRMAFHIAPNVANGQNQAGAANAPPGGVQDAQLNGPAGGGVQGGIGGGVGGGGGGGGLQPAAARAAMRYINLGPIRLGFAQGGQEVAELANRMGVDLNDANHNNNAAQAMPQGVNMPTGGVSPTPADLSSMDAVRNRLLEVDLRIQQEIRDIQQGMLNAQTAQQELQLMNMLLHELARLRQSQNPNQQYQQQQPQQPQQQQFGPPIPTIHQQLHFPPPIIPGQIPLPAFPSHPMIPRMGSPAVSRHAAPPNATAIPAGSPDLPEGVVLPQGWSLLPLQRLDQAGAGGPVAPQATATAPDHVHNHGQLHHYLHHLHEQQHQQQHQQQQQQQQETQTHIQPDTAASQPSSNPAENAAPNTNGASSDASMPVSTSPVIPPSRAPEVEVAAPTPVTPHWGGSAQLFGGQNGSGASVSLDTHNNPERAQDDTAGAGATAGEEGTHAPAENGESNILTPSSSVAKGKAPVGVTVEDAEDES
ncbi:hypothetical protein BD289DRAFT_451095 [Coniella lustricola]|uniref:RING-type E3 ubiquitin transferase n=1 Tax=Coniella lustricola TaxID=2025994 RepID=A0A2T3AG02_9PEZI|nr:hypothetical protein BD289DRAFT_451095 [Coniella lustricola]